MEKTLNLPERPTKKRCLKCKEVDVTTFSKCRNCGTKYDAALPGKSGDINLALPGFLFVVALVFAFAFYQYGQFNHIQNVYSHLDKFIGQSLKCRSEFALVATNQQDMRSLDAELAAASKDDAKSYGTKGLGGIMSVASALDAAASGKEGSAGVISRFYRSGRIGFVESDSDSPLSVTLLAATDSSDKYPLVQVRVLNGPNAGVVRWMNADQLDLLSK